MKRKSDPNRQLKDMEKRARKAATQRAMDKCLNLIYSKEDFMFTMEMPKEIVHHTYSVDIRKSHLKAWVEHEELDFNHIDMYIRLT